MANAYARLVEIHELQEVGELPPGKVTSMSEALHHHDKTEYGRPSRNRCIAYDLVRTDSGGARSLSASTRPGTDESARRAKQWVATNASDIRADQPAVAEGPVIVHVEAETTAATSISNPVFASS